MSLQVKANDFVSILYDIATTKQSVYAWGMCGYPINREIVSGKARQYPSWYTDSKVKNVFEPLYGRNPPVWGFDCIGLIKAVLWGWNDGGAVYCSNGVPDVTANAMIIKCSDVSSQFDNLTVGEYLWMPDHCGIYIGNGLAVESSPRWKNGVQITAINYSKADYNTRYWSKHGKLPYVAYDADLGATITKGEKTVTIELTVLKKGSKGEQVKTLQRLLNAFGEKLEVDGDFGSKTYSAVWSYQAKNDLEVDGIVGKNTWNSLLK